ncbi:hypothetical protein ACH5RR_011593 [Cinchona calisaya]|uniref:BHLH domain-containing protein n=1 Tax=Cinchona calisaya TaxID=153742 RepID=A0ABD3A8X9_9GENT
MDYSTVKWLSELDLIDDPALNNQWQMNSVDQSVNHDFSFNQFSPDHESCSTYQSSGPECPPPEVYQATNIPKPSQKSSNSPKIISFGNENFNSPACISQQNYGKPKHIVKTELSDEMKPPLRSNSINFSTKISPKNSFEEQQCGGPEYGDVPFKKGSYRSPLQAQDHVLAERKRREKLSQKFIALSAIVPGLKKLDKASVIGGAIKYLKQLEERIKKFKEEKQQEEGEKKRKPEESVVSAKRPRPACYNNNNNDEASSCVENSESSFEQSSTEIEVRTSGGQVLLNVLCKKHSGIMMGFFSEIEKFHLSIASSSFMPFGDSMLLITAVAQMEDKFCMTAEDLANNIRQAILKLS